MLKQSRPGIKTLFSWLQDKLEKKKLKKFDPTSHFQQLFNVWLNNWWFLQVQYYWKNKAFKIFISSTDIIFFVTFINFLVEIRISGIFCSVIRLNQKRIRPPPFDRVRVSDCVVFISWKKNLISFLAWSQFHLQEFPRGFLSLFLIP